MDTMTPIEQTAEVPPPSRGRGATVVAAVLALAIVGAAGFLAGFYVKKGKTTNASATQSATNTTAAPDSSGGGAGGPGGPGARNRGGGTAGQVSTIDGANLVVSDLSGNSVKVTTTPQTRVSKTVPGSVQDINNGDTITIQGTRNPDGTITAQTIIILPPGANVGRGGRGGQGGAGGGAPGGGANPPPTGG